MPNPIETERRFQNLLSRLAFPASPRQRLLSIVTFLESFCAGGASASGGDRRVDQFESYVLELLQQVPALILETECAGIDPAILLAVYSRLFALQESLPPDVRPAGLDESLFRLRHLTALQFAFVGDLSTSVEVSGDSTGTQWMDKLSSSIDLLPRARLQRAHEKAQRADLATAEHLAGLLNAWPAYSVKDARLPARQESVLMPEVEQQLMEGQHARSFGSLRRVTLNVLASAHDRDHLHTDVAVYGVDNGSSHHIEVVAEAARSLVRETNPARSSPFIKAQVTFDGKHELHRGDSSDLAIAALAYSAMLRFANERNQYRLLPTTAMTGALTADGQVLPVDPDGLARKVDAAFFSAAICMVVPRQQLASAEEIADGLRLKYPLRHLALIGVSHLREVFYDRRVADVIRVPLARHVVNKAWKWRRPIAAVILLTLGLAVFRLAYGPLDKNPVIYAFSGEMLLLKNKSNQQIEEIRVGERTVYATNEAGDMIQPVGFADIDGDGRNEVFWWQFPPDGPGNATTVNCKSIGEDTVRWSFVTSKTIHFLQSTDVSTPEFRAQRLIVEDLDGDGKQDVLVSALHNAFPCLVFKLDALSGGEISHYLHIGHLNDMRAWDLDGDGMKEVILCGANNAFKNACLVMLDPRNLSGVSPTTGDYVPAGYTPAREKAYMRIPRTVLGSLYEKVVKYNYASWIHVEPEKRTLRMHVTDVHGIGERPNERVSADFDLIMGFNLSPVDITSGDNFDALYDYHLREKQIPSVNRNEYLREYKKTMFYWDGRDWRTSP